MAASAVGLQGVDAEVDRRALAASRRGPARSRRRARRRARRGGSRDSRGAPASGAPARSRGKGGALGGGDRRRVEALAGEERVEVAALGRRRGRAGSRGRCRRRRASRASGGGAGRRRRGRARRRGPWSRRSGSRAPSASARARPARRRGAASRSSIAAERRAPGVIARSCARKAAPLQGAALRGHPRRVTVRDDTVPPAFARPADRGRCHQPVTSRGRVDAADLWRRNFPAHARPDARTRQFSPGRERCGCVPRCVVHLWSLSKCQRSDH